MSKKIKALAKSQAIRRTAESRAPHVAYTLPAALSLAPRANQTTALMLSTALAMALTFSANQGQAQELRWTGDGATTFWSNGTNWSDPNTPPSNTPPSTDSDVIMSIAVLGPDLRQTSVVDEGATSTINSLSVTGDDFAITINDNLAVTNTITVAGASTITVAAGKELSAAGANDNIVLQQGAVVDVSGALSGRITATGDARLDLRNGGEVTGTVVLLDHGRVETQIGTSTITGTLTLSETDAQLSLTEGSLVVTGALNSAGMITIGADRTLTLTAPADTLMANGSSVTNISGTLDGSLETTSSTSAINLNNNGVITGTVETAGTMKANDATSVTGAITVAAAGGSLYVESGNLTATGGIQNSGIVDIASNATVTGTLALEGTTLNRSNTTIAGEVDGDVVANQYSTTTMTGTVTGDVEMAGTMSLQGEITKELTITSTGIVSLTGGLTVGKVINNNNFDVIAGNKVIGDIETSDGSTTSIAGTVEGNVTGIEGSITTLSGEITNDSDPAKGNVSMYGALEAQGSIAGNLEILGNGTVTLTGLLSAGKVINHNVFTVTATDTLDADLETRGPNGHTTIAGTVDGSVGGRFGSNTELTGIITGNTTMAGTMLAQNVIGGSLYIRDGGGVTTTGNLSVNGAGVYSAGDLVVGAGHTLTATTIELRNQGDATIDGVLQGNVITQRGSTLDLNTQTPGINGITGTLNAGGVATVRGSIGGAITVEGTGSVTTDGNLLANAGTTNYGTLIVAAGTTLTGAITTNSTVEGGTTFHGNTSIAGNVTGNVTGAEGTDTKLTGTITGDVDMDGNMSTVQGAVSGAFKISSNGNVSITGDFNTPTINNTGSLNITTGTTTAVIDTLTTGHTTISGTVVGNVTGQTNSDTYLTGGTLSNNLTMHGRMQARGKVDGTFDIISGGSVTTTGTLTALQVVNNYGTLDIAGNTTLDGAVMSYSGSNTSIAGELGGNLTALQGSLTTMTGGSKVDGTVAMSGLLSAAGEITGALNIDSTGNVTTTGSLTVTGGVTNDEGRLNVATGTLTGNVNTLAQGNTSIGGRVNGIVTGQEKSNTELTGRANAVIMDGTMKARGTIDGALTISGTGVVNTTGNLQSGSVSNTGRLTVEAGHTLTSAVTTGENGNTFIGGRVNGIVTGQEKSNTELTGRASAVIMHGTMEARGTIDGALTISGTGVVNTSGNLQSGSVSNTGQLNVKAGHTLTGTVTTQEHGNTNIAGTVTGPVIGLKNSDTTLTGSIGSTVQMDGRMEAQGTILGALTITGNGAVTTTGALQSGDIANSGSLDVALGSTVTAKVETLELGKTTIAGDVIGNVDVRDTGTLLLRGSVLNGNVNNNGTMTFENGANIGENFTNSGTLKGKMTGDADTTIFVGGTFNNSGTIERDNINSNGSIIIDADNIVMMGAAVPVYVLLRGGITNYTHLTYGNDDKFYGTFNNMPGGTLTIVGTVGKDTTRVVNIRNEGTLTVTGTGHLQDVNQIDNHNIANFAVGSTVDATHVINHSTGQLTVAGILNSELTNAGNATISGTVRDDVLNTGTMELSGRLNGNLENTNSFTGTATGQIDQNIINTGMLDHAGSVGGTVDNRSSGTATIGGNVGGAVTNAGTITLNGTVASLNNTAGTASVNGAVTGALDNAGIVNLAGTVGGPLTNTASGTVNVTENSAAASVSNAGGLNIAATKTFTVAGGVTSSGAVKVDGTLAANLTSTGDIELNAGQISGAVDSSRNLQVNGNSSVTGALQIRAGSLNIANDAQLTATGLTTISDGASATNRGTLVGNVLNQGTYVQTGTLTGDLTTSGIADLADVSVSGNLSYLGGALNYTTLEVGGTFLTDQDFAVGSGKSLTAGAYTFAASSTVSVTNGGRLAVTNPATGLISNDGRLQLDRGQVIGNVQGGTISLNNASSLTGSVTASGLSLLGSSTVSGGVTGGTITSQGSNTVLGAVNNTTSISLASATPSGEGDRLALGSLVGSGTVLTFDTDLGDSQTLGTLHRDLITVNGAVTGSFSINLNDLTDPNPVEREGAPVVLLQATDLANMQITSLTGLNDTSLRYSHSLVRDGNQLVIRTELDSAIAAIAGSVSLSQSLIGALVNRPTSPYTVSRALAEPDRNCAPGGWARATGGTASLNGKINSDDGTSVTSHNGEIDVNYYGMQFGGDLSCFNGSIAGWDMSFGFLGGLNHGSGTQGAIALPSNVIATTSSSRTDNEFDQSYLGLYATASRGRVIADLQIRGEQTDFKLNNSAIGLSNADLEVKAATISGAVTTSFPLGDPANGWNVLPTAGFMISKAKSSDLTFSSGDMLKIEDHTTQLAFAGAAISRLKIAESGDAAMSYFATGTYYHDFSKDMESTYTIQGVATPTSLSSEVLGSYGEVSLGMNYLKVLEKGPLGLPAKQFNAAVRVDGRFSDKLNSYAITGQVRWQF